MTPAILERTVRYLPLVLTLSLAITPALSAQTRAIRTVSADGADAALGLA